MRRILPLSLALALLAPAAADARGPSTPEERKRAVAVARALEREPHGPGADDQRRWVVDWIVAIPDLHVISCNGPLDRLMETAQEGNERNARDLYIQHVVGMAAWLAEDPKRQGDWVGLQVAALRSVLAAYRSLVGEGPGSRWEELDALQKIDGAGRLPDLVRGEMEGCDPGRLGTPDDEV